VHRIGPSPCLKYQPTRLKRPEPNDWIAAAHSRRPWVACLNRGTAGAAVSPPVPPGSHRPRRRIALPTCAALALAYNHCELHTGGFPFAFSSLRACLVPLLSASARSAAIDLAVPLRLERPSNYATCTSSTFQPQASSIVVEAEALKGATGAAPLPPRASTMPAHTGPLPASSAPP
jgi:hypothetical protein